MATTKRNTWTIEPDNDVRSLVSKEITRRLLPFTKSERKKKRRGLRTQIVMEAVRECLAKLRGKREGAL